MFLIVQLWLKKTPRMEKSTEPIVNFRTPEHSNDERNVAEKKTNNEIC